MIETELSPHSSAPSTQPDSQRLCSITKKPVMPSVADTESLQHELSCLQAIIEGLDEAILVVTSAARIRYANPAALKLLALDSHYPPNIDWRHLLASRLEDDRQYIALRQFISDTANAVCTESGELLQLQHPGGRLYWVQLRSSPLRYGDVVEGSIIRIHDATERRQAEKRMRWHATHDGLTHLANRSEFEHRLNLLFNTKQDEAELHALIYIDLDQIKLVNDTSGHSAGDSLIQQIAQLIKHDVQADALLARIGGDEFAILIQHCSLEHACKVAERIRKRIAQFYFVWGENCFNITASIGVTAIDPLTDNARSSFAHADLACYAAKDLGRNQVYAYHESEGALTAERCNEMNWLARMQRALVSEGLELYCQGIYPLKANRPVHLEVLVRLHDDGELVLPGAFLPAAERFGKVHLLDQWVVENALAIIKAHPALLDGSYRFNINIAGPTLCEEHTLKTIHTLVSEQPRIAKLLNFEITETSAITNLSKCISFIDDMRQLGCGFILDDFGSGVSSFTYLKSLPVQQIKIDGIFIRDIVLDAVDEAMVIAIQQIAAAMQIQSVAEYVEDQETLDLLREIGVDYAQGFGLEKPLPLKQKLHALSQEKSLKLA